MYKTWAFFCSTSMPCIIALFQVCKGKRGHSAWKQFCNPSLWSQRPGKQKAPISSIGAQKQPFCEKSPKWSKWTTQVILAQMTSTHYTPVQLWRPASSAHSHWEWSSRAWGANAGRGVTRMTWVCPKPTRAALISPSSWSDPNKGSWSTLV